MYSWCRILKLKGYIYCVTVEGNLQDVNCGLNYAYSIVLKLSPHYCHTWAYSIYRLPSSSDGKAYACSAELTGSTPGLGRSTGEGNCNPLQYTCLENSKDRGAWPATVHGVAKSWTWLRPFRTNTQKRCPFHYRGLECKSRKSRNTWKWSEMKSLSLARLFVTPWIVAYQAPPSIGFFRQEYWSGLPFPSPGNLPNPGIEPRSPTLEADTLTSEPTGKPWSNRRIWPWSTQWSRGKASRVLPRECTGRSKYPLPMTQEKTLHMDITRWPTLKSYWLYSLQPKMEKLYTVSKNKTGSWLWLWSWTPYCQIQT